MNASVFSRTVESSNSVGGRKGLFDVTNRFAIAVIAFALAFLPCAKFAFAWTGPEVPSTSDISAALAQDADVVMIDDTSDKLCVKCCSKSKAVVSRAEPLTVPQISKHLPVADWFEQPQGPTNAAVLTIIRARGPPPLLAGTSYKAIFAKTSRFQT